MKGIIFVSAMMLLLCSCSNDDLDDIDCACGSKCFCHYCMCNHVSQNAADYASAFKAKFGNSDVSYNSVKTVTMGKE